MSEAVKEPAEVGESVMEVKWEPGLEPRSSDAEQHVMDVGHLHDNETKPEPLQFDKEMPDVFDAPPDTSLHEDIVSGLKCIICNSYLTSETVLVKEKGIKTLLLSSQKRADGKEAFFSNCQEIRLHRKCRHTYTNWKSVLAGEKRAPARDCKARFDFNRYCVFCAEAADEEFVMSQFELPAESRRPVGRASHAGVQRAVERAAALTDDEWTRQVLNRIDSVSLQKENAVYHTECLSRFVSVHRGARAAPAPAPPAACGRQVLALLGPHATHESPSALSGSPTHAEHANSVEKCIICNLNVSSNELIVKERELPRLIEASQQRGDGKEDLFRSKKELRLHKFCKSVYTSRSSINNFRMRMEDSSGLGQFDFESLCFFCGEDAGEEYMKLQCKQPVNKRVAVYRVSRPSTQLAVARAAATHCDHWSRQVLQRIYKVNLLEMNAVYHKNCYSMFSFRTRGGKRGRVPMPEISEAIDHIHNYLESYTEDCQITMADLRAALPNVALPSDNVIMYSLEKRYGSGIVVSRSPAVVSFVTPCKIPDSWYESREKNVESEKLRIIDMAANIIIEDMQARVYKVDYPSPVDFLDAAREDCPETLLRLLRAVIVGNKPDPERYEQKCLALTHAVVGAARPMSFRSPILLGLSSLIHHKYSSRYLLDALSGLGFCASYDETLRFQASATASHDSAAHKHKPQSTQFIFDSANRDTMLGIQCTNPPASNAFNERIPRLSHIPSNYPKRVEQIPTLSCSKPPKSALKEVLFTPPAAKHDTLLTQSDLLCMYGKSKRLPNAPGLDNLMRFADTETNRAKLITEVKPIPFINCSASTFDDVLTALDLATRQCEKSDIECCVVTLDQPLYQHAQRIVKASKDPHISRIILRLGGCGLLKSFMGAVGKIMSGSGLEELWANVYTSESVDRMLTAQYYERAVRAHWLTSVALFDIITKHVVLDPKEKFVLERSLFVLLDGKIIDIDGDVADSVIKKIATSLEEHERRGPTAALWASYFKMAMVIQHFIQADRTADWQLHVSCISKMLPYLHAAGHFEYAKSAALYLQDMDNLKAATTPESFQKFVSERLFTGRTTKDRSCGSSGDFIIRRSLMRSLNGEGRDGLENWARGLPILNCVYETIENFCLHSVSDSGDKNDTKARIARDEQDLGQFFKWFAEHDPFPHTQNIMSISSGLTGDGSINPQDALKIGREIMENRKGTSFADIKYSRDEAIRSLAVLNSAITLDKKSVPIEPDLILKRISRLKKTPTELRSYLQHELAPYPLALFDKSGLRKTDKAEFYQLFEADTDGYDGDGKAHIIDGGFLLQDIVWDHDKVGNVIAMYVEYVKQFPNPTVVFEGYTNEMCIKTQAQLRTAQDLVPVEFDEDTEITLDQKRFLSNVKNKGRLIEILIRHLTAEDIQALQCSGVADTVIVRVAVAMAESKRYPAVTIISDNADVLAVLTSRNSADVSMLRPGKQGTPVKLYHAASFIGDPDMALVAHAFTGSDTTSAIYKRGKTLACSKILDDRGLRWSLNIFKDPLAETADIVKAGVDFFCHLYRRKESKTCDLKDLRYKEFARSFTKSRRDLTALPPTISAAKQHSLRVYYQVQKWLDNELNPTEWGWERQASGLCPVTTLDDLIPRDILKEISCKCKTSCAGCSCVEAGLECSALCVNCVDRTCCRELVTEPADVDEEMELRLDRSEVQFDENARQKAARNKSKRQKMK